jgi:hypothetical protein
VVEPEPDSEVRRSILTMASLIGAAAATWLGYLVAHGMGALVGCFFGAVLGAALGFVVLWDAPALIWPLFGTFCAGRRHGAFLVVVTLRKPCRSAPRCHQWAQPLCEPPPATPLDGAPVAPVSVRVVRRLQAIGYFLGPAPNSVGYTRYRGEAFMDTHQRIAHRVLAEHSAIAERLRTNPAPVLDYALGNIARWSKEFAPDRKPDWLVEWKQLLKGPLESLVVALTTDSDVATHLRETSPFVGFLTFKERVEVLRHVDPDMARTLESFEVVHGESAALSAESAGHSRSPTKGA